MGDITWLGEFTARPPPLSQLRNLNIRSRLREGGQGAKDILKLATVLSPLQVCDLRRFVNCRSNFVRARLVVSLML